MYIQKAYFLSRIELNMNILKPPEHLCGKHWLACHIHDFGPESVTILFVVTINTDHMKNAVASQYKTMRCIAAVTVPPSCSYFTILTFRYETRRCFSNTNTM